MCSSADLISALRVPLQQALDAHNNTKSEKYTTGHDQRLQSPVRSRTQEGGRNILIIDDATLADQLVGALNAAGLTFRPAMSLNEAQPLTQKCRQN
ncbi:hypothetical protein [Deinococcus ruber]|uniref:hypothetical protein n=1 Tax=Deinococcus ruber TaxID=1848197 RepID=UPI001667AE76|nr:hypothetical protein [Deinococcus ruber]